jgi:hypothetical protein
MVRGLVVRAIQAFSLAIGKGLVCNKMQSKYPLFIVKWLGIEERRVNDVSEI